MSQSQWLTCRNLCLPALYVRCLGRETPPDNRCRRVERCRTPNHCRPQTRDGTLASTLHRHDSLRAWIVVLVEVFLDASMHREGQSPCYLHGAHTTRRCGIVFCLLARVRLHYDSSSSDSHCMRCGTRIVAYVDAELCEPADALDEEISRCVGLVVPHDRRLSIRHVCKL